MVGRIHERLPRLCRRQPKQLSRHSRRHSSLLLQYSTWTAPGIYIEDMIIFTSRRGKGYGKALMVALAREVVGVEGVNGSMRSGWERCSGRC
jgi:hypothetical protein